MIGRVVNIIEDSKKFILDGITFNLPKNCVKDHFHRGFEGFDNKIYLTELFKTPNYEPDNV